MQERDAQKAKAGPANGCAKTDGCSKVLGDRLAMNFFVRRSVCVHVYALVRSLRACVRARTGIARPHWCFHSIGRSKRQGGRAGGRTREAFCVGSWCAQHRTHLGCAMSVTEVHMDLCGASLVLDMAETRRQVERQLKAADAAVQGEAWQQLVAKAESPLWRALHVTLQDTVGSGGPLPRELKALFAAVGLYSRLWLQLLSTPTAPLPKTFAFLQTCSWLLGRFACEWKALPKDASAMVQQLEAAQRWHLRPRRTQWVQAVYMCRSRQWVPHKRCRARRGGQRPPPCHAT